MKKKTNKAIAVGASVAALAAAAAGVYMLTGKNGKKNRKIAGKWIDNIQDDVIKELGQVKKITKASYHKVIDTATKNYKGIKNISASELAVVAKELKSNWDNISAELNTATKTVKRVVPKAAKNIAKKATSAAKQVTKVAKKAVPKKKTARKSARKTRR